MALFYFNFRDETGLHADESGTAFETVEDAYLGAYEAAADLWRELLKDRRDPRNCAFEVTDEGGRPMFELAFSEVLESCNGGKTSVRRVHSSVYAEILESYNKSCLSRARFDRQLRETKETLEETRKLIASVNRLI
jgi:hypothetical protein